VLTALMARPMLNGRRDPPALADMSPEQIKVLQDSFDRFWGSGRVVDLFYDRLFVIAPHARSLFPADMEMQKLKFTDMLASIIGLIERQDMFTSIIENLGRRHARYGVVEADYAHVAEALMLSLEQGLGGEFTDEVRSAWAALYEMARNIMIEASRKDGLIEPTRC
jgi:hemoglobin-like flavoprotein